MNIQQSINQMLYTGTVAAGLYAHSPAGKEAADIRAKAQGVTKAAANTSKALGAAIKNEQVTGQDLNKSIFETPVGEQLTDFGAQEVQKRKELFEADPSDKNYKAYQKAKKGMEALLRSKKRHLEDKELRKKLVEGTAEDPNVVPMKKTKVEVNTDGNK